MTRLGFRYPRYLYLCLLVLMGFCLRLFYMVHSSPFVDEYSSLLAVRSILDRGLPLLPSGLFYGHGLLFSYLDALFALLFGTEMVVLRLPSLLVGTLTIPFLYLLGRRAFAPGVGLLAATIWALDPEAILWGGRSRAYALLPFLVILLLLAARRGIWEGDEPRQRAVFALCFLVALFTHAEIALLLPAILGAIALSRGLSWVWQRRDLLISLGIAGAGVLLRLYLQRLMVSGVPGGVEIIASRPALQISWSPLTGAENLLPFFLGFHRLPWALLWLLGLLLLWRGREMLGERYKGFIFLNILLIFVLLEMVLIVGETWQSSRYLFQLLPLLFLLAATSLYQGSEWFSRRGYTLLTGEGIMGLVSVAVAVLLIPGGLGAASQQELGYDLAFQYVKEHWREGDAIATSAPAASYAHLGRNDYFVLHKGYEEYIMRKTGVWVDRWLGSLFVGSTEEFGEALKGSSRLWLVVDEVRFRTRYDPNFAQLVWERMELLEKERGVMVFRESEDVVQGPRYTVYENWEGEIALLGYDLESVVIEPGQDVSLSLYWEALTRPRGSYAVFLHLIDKDGDRRSQEDSLPMGGLYPTTHWYPGEVIRDHYRLPIPPDLEPGRYRLEVGLYDASTLDRLSVWGEDSQPLGDVVTLDYLRLLGPTEKEPQNLREANLGGVIRLLGYDLATGHEKARGEAGWLLPGDRLRLTLFWQRVGVIEEDYTIFVHLLDRKGKIISQHDGQPEEGFYSTSFWDEEEIVRDYHELFLPFDAPRAEYRLMVGIYLWATGDRLPILDPQGRTTGDMIFLEEIEIR